MSIKPFISPKELKARIDAGENWVPINYHEVVSDLYSQTYEYFGYEKVQKVGWINIEEQSPLELGIPMGPVNLLCSAKKEIIKDESNQSEKMIITYEPCWPIVTAYGLLTEDCERFIKKNESAPVEYVGKAVSPSPCENTCVSE